MAQQEPHEVQQREGQVLHLGRNKCRHPHMLGANRLESSCSEKVLGVLVDKML